MQHFIKIMFPTPNCWADKLIYAFTDIPVVMMDMQTLLESWHCMTAPGQGLWDDSGGFLFTFWCHRKYIKCKIF